MNTRKPRLGSIYRPKYRGPDGSLVESQVWWLKYYVNGRPVRESAKTEDWNEAERLLKRRQGEQATGKFAGLGPERIRMAQLFEAVVEDYTANGKHSLPDVKFRLRLHLLPAFGHLRAAEFGSNHVGRYIEQRRRAEAANATINRELAIVRRAFTLAAQADPPRVTRLVHIPSLKENNVRKGFLEHTAYTRLRDELPEYLRPLFVVAYHTGARRGELTRVQWPQVDFTADRIRLNPGETKNNEPRTLPIYGEMREWLLMAKETRDLGFPDCPWVLHENGRRIQTFRKAWASACQRAGVGGLLFHDLRRSAVRNMVRAGIPEKVAMAISGHKTQSVFQRYNIVSERDLTDAAARMEQYVEAATKAVQEAEAAGTGKVMGKVTGAYVN